MRSHSPPRTDKFKITMIRTYFGLARDPFTIDEDAPLMEHRQRHFDILRVHNRQGGLCLILGSTYSISIRPCTLS